MKIHYNDTFLDVIVNDSSYRYRAIKGEHSLTLYFSLAEHVEIPVGAWCEFQSETYTLEKPENFKMHNTRNFEYTLVMEASQAKLKKYKFRNTVNGSLKFNLTAKPQEHLKMLVDNLNSRDGEWVAGECVTAVAKLVSYNHASCEAALSQIADAFETEWEIVGKTIHIRKVEYNKENPLPLSYGRGNGFKPGVGRANFSDSKPVEVLFVQGGEKNIDASKYKNKELLLPKNRTLQYDGRCFEGEVGFDADEARTYITDAQGLSLRRADKELQSGVEDSLDLSEIYPSRVGDVTRVEVTAEGFCDFFDATIPDALDFSLPDSRFKGETMSVIFQSGELAGKEFEIQQNDETVFGYVHAERRFKVVEQIIDGQPMPRGVMMPVVGDKYAVFGVDLPDAYVCDDATKSGASWEMFRQAAKYMYENEEPKFSFTGELDGIWAKKDWVNIGGRIKLGGYILFSDEQFQKDGIGIRIVGVKDFINNPHSPEIELSNSVVGSSIMSDIRKIESNEVVTDSQHKEALQFTKRRFRDAQQTSKMLEEALLKNFSGSINPLTVSTMQMLVGDESLQFRFVDNVTNPVAVRHDITYESGQLKAQAGILQHMTLGISSLSSTHKYRFWTLDDYTSAVLDAPEQSYFLYAVVSKGGTTGVFELSGEAHPMEGATDYYLLCGVLNSEYDGSRSFAQLYGYTEILPGRITTDRVVSADGQNFMDFVASSFRIGDRKNSLSWNLNDSGQLILEGAMVQSPSGSVSPITIHRGDWVGSELYYSGDEVFWNDSTYRCISDCPSVGAAPTNATYWRQLSKGVESLEIGGANLILDSKVVTVGAWVGSGANRLVKLVKGRQYTLSYDSTDMVVANDFPQFYIWSDSWEKPMMGLGTITSLERTFVFTLESGEYYLSVYNHNYPTGGVFNKLKLERGNKATDWSPAPEDLNRAIMYQGEFKTGRAYYNNSSRQDVVKYGSAWYRYIGANGQAASAPPSVSHWERFGASFESIATGTLLAEGANLAGFIFKEGVLHSQDTTDGKPNISINGKTGSAVFNNVTMRGEVFASGGEIGNMRINKDKQLAMLDDEGNAVTLLSKGRIPSLSQMLSGNEPAGTTPIPSVILEPTQSVKTAVSGDHRVVNNGAKLIVNGTITLRVEDDGQPNSEAWLTVTAYLKSNLGVNVHLGSTSCSSRNASGQTDNQAVLDYSTTLNSVDAGYYYISVDYASMVTGGGTAYAAINTGTFKSEFTAAANQSYLGRGVAVIMDANNHLYYGYDDGGTPLLTYKGVTNMPGVLAAGTVAGYGTISDSWGYREVKVNKKSVGVYEIVHNIGHTQYFFTANAQYLYPPRICTWYNKWPNSIYVRIADGWDTPSDVNFDFQITGRN